MSVYISKRKKTLSTLAPTEKKAFTIREAVGLVKQAPKTKFDQSVALQVKYVGDDPKTKKIKLSRKALIEKPADVKKD